MRAMVLERVDAFSANARPLVASDVPIPRPSAGQLLIRVSACGVCHTELDEIEGRLATAVPRIPGHQVVGNLAHLLIMARNRRRPGRDARR